MKIIAQHEDIAVIEVCNGYQVLLADPDYGKYEDGKCRGMGDGVGLYGDDDNQIMPGTEEFNQAVQNDLQSNYSEWMEAYFTDEEREELEYEVYGG